MKIAIVNNGLAGGGIERASTSLANYWAREGHSISLLALYQSDPFFSLENSIEFKEPGFPFKGYKYVYTLRMMQWLRSQVRKINPTAILAFGESTNPYVLLALKGLNIPVYVSDRMHPKARLPQITFWLKKKLYPRAAGVIAQTQLAKDVLSSYIQAANIHVIPNPVNAIEPLPMKKLKQIVSVGRLEPVKGHEYLLRAFAKLNAPDWELSIVGDGSLMSELKSLALELNVADRVHFHGHKQDFRKELSEAVIYVLPSLKEGFPNALLEAMSVPLACIATDFMGTPNEIIKDGVNGKIVPVKDTEQMAGAIRELIAAEDLRARLAREAYKVREQFSFEHIAHRYLSIISNNA